MQEIYKYRYFPPQHFNDLDKIMDNIIGNCEIDPFYCFPIDKYTLLLYFCDLNADKYLWCNYDFKVTNLWSSMFYVLDHLQGNIGSDLKLKRKTFECIKILLNKKADPNHLTSFTTPLIAACQNTTLTGVIKLLLEYKAEPDLSTHISPLQQAIKSKNNDAINLLCIYGASIPKLIGEEKQIIENNVCMIVDQLFKFIFDIQTGIERDIGRIIIEYLYLYDLFITLPTTFK